jgi:hypothetical protein
MVARCLQWGAGQSSGCAGRPRSERRCRTSPSILVAIAQVITACWRRSRARAESLPPLGPTGRRRPFARPSPTAYGASPGSAATATRHRSATGMTSGVYCSLYRCRPIRLHKVAERAGRLRRAASRLTACSSERNPHLPPGRIRSQKAARWGRPGSPWFHPLGRTRCGSGAFLSPLWASVQAPSPFALEIELDFKCGAGGVG